MVKEQKKHNKMKKNKIPKKLIKFIEKHNEIEECFVNPKIKVGVETKIPFTQTETVKGLIICAEGYPLNNIDVSIQNHLNVVKAIKNVKQYGVVYKIGFNLPNDILAIKKMYMYGDGKVNPILLSDTIFNPDPNE